MTTSFEVLGAGGAGGLGFFDCDAEKSGISPCVCRANQITSAISLPDTSSFLLRVEINFSKSGDLEIINPPHSSLSVVTRLACHALTVLLYPLSFHQA